MPNRVPTVEPPNYRPMYRPDDVYAIWMGEFTEIARTGGVMTLVLHPQLTARPSRLAMLRQLLFDMRDGGAWFATGTGICDWALGTPTAD